MSWEIGLIIGISMFLYILLEIATRFSVESNTLFASIIATTLKYLLMIVAYIGLFILLIFTRSIVEANQATIPANVYTNITHMIDIAMQIHIYVSVLIFALSITLIIYSIIQNIRMDRKFKQIQKEMEDE